MKVFISWSGERSRYIAAALRDWLPNVIQSLDPWMSDKDIDGGSRWLLALAGQLSEAMTGILCVTPENQSNPWLVFEAGALSKTIGQTMVCPLLYELEPAQLTGPLSQFQAKALDQTSVLSILNTLNTSMTVGKLTSERLERAFTRCWPELEAKLKKVPTNEAAHKPKRKADDMLEEILTIVRDQRRREVAQAARYDDLQRKATLTSGDKELTSGVDRWLFKTPSRRHDNTWTADSMNEFLKKHNPASGLDKQFLAAALQHYDPVEIARIFDAIDDKLASSGTGNAAGALAAAIDGSANAPEGKP